MSDSILRALVILLLAILCSCSTPIAKPEAFSGVEALPPEFAGREVAGGEILLPPGIETLLSATPSGESPLEVGRIFAVAANFRSHLEHDLAIELSSGELTALRRARPRVFQKFPIVAPPGKPLSEHPFRGLVGPNEDLRAPAFVDLPGHPAEPSDPATESHLDYEVELGVLLGEEITRERAATASDEELWGAVSGYLLVSDAKVRNPQVYLKVARVDEELNAGAKPYTTGNAKLDRALGPWDATTVAWWSYAASFGDYASIGPRLCLRDPGETGIAPRLLLLARRYGTSDERGMPPPSGTVPGRFHLRQCTVVSTAPDAVDPLIWDLPAIIRSLLAEDSALALGSNASLRRGDVISLGTPGGTVLTARSQGLFDTLAWFLSTWTPIDWHDFFFKDDTGLYLRPGDEVLLYGLGLGVQLHKIAPPAR